MMRARTNILSRGRRSFIRSLVGFAGVVLTWKVPLPSVSTAQKITSEDDFLREADRNLRESVNQLMEELYAIDGREYSPETRRELVQLFKTILIQRQPRTD